MAHVQKSCKKLWIISSSLCLSTEEQRDFLGRLILARDEHTGRGLSDEELRNQVLSLLIAGHEVKLTYLNLYISAFSKES